MRRLLRKVLGGQAPVAPPPPVPAAPRYGEPELLARTEEFNRNAEAYWLDVARDPLTRQHALNKPCGTVPDAVNTLYRLGLVIADLHLGVGHSVLDFGAGSCWLSSFLNRLGCSTVSIDVSPTALELGQELFALDPRHREQLKPRFLAYDGHRIPLDAESVDRIVCFDAFHHVPNQDEVLAEMYRVLKPGGRAVLAEPGEGHSHADHSLFETERCGVLENELDLRELVAKAQQAGFSGVTAKPYPDPGIALPAADYLRLMDGDHAVYPMNVLQRDLRHFYLLALLKGEESFDSRNPRLLRAEIEVPEALRVLRGRGGWVCSLPVTLRNAGDTLWLHRLDPLGGFVMLAGHLYDAQGTPIVRDFVSRHPLPRDVAPGESVEVVVDVPLPSELGRYTLRLDLVDDRVIWFSQAGSPTRDVGLEVTQQPAGVEARGLLARLERVDAVASLRARPGTQLELRVRATNAGRSAWTHASPPAPGSVSLGGHLLAAGGAFAARDALRAELGRDVAPGESVEIACRFRAPLDPGAYQVKLDLVLEHVCWFEQRGSAPLLVALEVPDELPDSLDPGLLRAALELREPASPLHAAGGERLALRLALRNVGNTRWLHASAGGRGHVAVGGHLLGEDGSLIEHDFLRARLPRDLAPGDALELELSFRAPPTPGRYRLELDMVDEGVCWFAPQGSPPLRLDLVTT